MPLSEHLNELRYRIIVVLISVFILAIASYFFADWTLKILCQPFFAAFKTGQLIGTGPAEAFVLKLKVALFTGLALSIPVISHQVWRFIAPGLYEEEKKLIIPFLLSSVVLFICGVIFCYYAVIPIAFSFFYDQYQSIGMSALVKTSEHLSTMLLGLFAFGIAFEVPVLAYFLGRLGVLSYKFLIQYARHAIVLIFVVAAIFTPPDVVSQFLMAGPLLFLYGISILVVKYSERRRSTDVS